MWPWNAHWSIIWMAQHWWSGKISGHELLQTLNTSELYMNKMYKIINCLFGHYFMRSEICEAWAMSESFRSISLVVFDNFPSFVSCTKLVNVKFFFTSFLIRKKCVLGISFLEARQVLWSGAVVQRCSYSSSWKRVWKSWRCRDVWFFCGVMLCSLHLVLVT